MEKELNLFNELVEKLIQDESEHPVVQPIAPSELVNKFSLELGEIGCSDEDFAEHLKNIALHTPKTASKRFFNQLFGGRQPKAVLGDLLAVVLNNSMYTYKVAGPQVGIEKEILRRVADLIGYSDNFAGTFPPGGSMSNFMALLMARDKFNSRIKHRGMEGELVMYTSEISHYSNQKNASLAGIGRDNVQAIPCDEHGKMIASKLDKQISTDLGLGKKPFFINATAATTVIGSYDNINELADIAQKYNLWLHVDGAYGGAVLFSETYRHLIEGIERSDSFSFNAHKMLGTPLVCSILLASDGRYLKNSFDNEAEYLYQTSDDDYNLGKTSLQCGRRNDALKLWTLWKSIGSEGLRSMVDHQFALAEVARNYVEKHPDYELYTFKDSISVGFNYKGIDPRALCTALYEAGELMVGYGEFKGNEFVRLVTINANNSEEDILNFFSILENFVSTNEELFFKKEGVYR